MKKRRTKESWREVDPEIRYMIKKVWSRTQPRDWKLQFLRVNNRKKHITRADVSAAGYPHCDLKSHLQWQEVHKWCKENFGERYVWFGERFFFQDEKSRDLFDKKWNT